MEGLIKGFIIILNPKRVCYTLHFHKPSRRVYERVYGRVFECINSFHQSSEGYMKRYLNGLIGSINHKRVYRRVSEWVDWFSESSEGFMEGYLNGLIGSINRQKGLWKGI
jgi:hypothetical protein